MVNQLPSFDFHSVIGVCYVHFLVSVWYYHLLLNSLFQSSGTISLCIVDIGHLQFIFIVIVDICVSYMKDVCLQLGAKM